MAELEQRPLNTVFLDNYGTDLTKMATEGEAEAVTVIGPQKQIERVMQILCKKKKNNACLVSDAGFGQTIVAQGLAQRILKGMVPQKLLKTKVYSVEMERVNDGKPYRSEIKERLSRIVDEVKASNGAIILFIDELHQALDYAASILKPALARGELMFIGATTLDEYSSFIEKEPSLKSAFSLVEVPEPTVEETVEILKRVRNKYEVFHRVKYTDNALEAAVSLSKLHISEGLLPDKAIDLIDEAGARAQLQGKSQTMVVTEADIRKQVSDITGISVEKVATNDEESTRLLKMEDVFARHIIGQEEAVGAVSRAIRRASAGLRNPNRPIASFLFVGPTGVGKTELAKLLATEYFGSKEAMVRLDMSEYMEKHTVSKLFGSPPGYVGYDDGGQLTEAVKRRPHNLILFDEIEKAHPDVYNALLQILDDGRLTDSKGKTVDFKNTIIIMTSNVGGHLSEESDDDGTSSVKERVGGELQKVFKLESDDDGTSSVKERVGEELQKVFKPEFLNRIDEVVVFKRLGRSQMKVILNGMLEEVNAKLKKKKLRLVVTENLKKKLLEEGFSPIYGARAMKRTISRLIEDNLAERILKGKVSEGRVFMDVDDVSN